MDLPTTVEEFICFLDGASVEPYGNQGPTFIGNLKSTIEIALFEALNDAPRGEELKIPIKIFRFLRQQVFRKLQIPHQRTLASELDLLSANIRVIQAACGEWVHGFIQTRLSFSSEETPNLTSESQWWSLLQDLLRDCDKGEAPTQINDIRITEISHELLSCMRLYLDDLKYEEMARQAVKSLTLASVRGMGFQDGIDSGIFQLQDWQKAWEQPFRGRALCALETKLQLNAHAIMNDEKKARMSRIVPVVQASGTGKSRLSEEFVKNNFAVMVSMWNGSGFPHRDLYVSEYFKNALTLGRSLDRETPSSAHMLPPINDEHKKDLNVRLNNDGIPKEEESVYHGPWRFQKPTKDSIPKAWAAGARMRVACFFVGLFNTMVDYMNRGICDSVEKWRKNFLHTGNSYVELNRNQFWKDVVTAALYELRPESDNGNRKLMESWLNQDPKPTIPNHIIDRDLQKILEAPIKQFFNHPVTTQCLAESTTLFRGPSGRSSATEQVVPFLFIVDEAAYLYQSNYMDSFMWVLDQPIVNILTKLQTDPKVPNDNASNFFVLMLGTHSQISHFTPHYTYPSERYLTGEQHITSVFLSLDWDAGLRPCNGKSRLHGSSHIENLVQWGRPLWSAIYDGLRPAEIKALVTDKMDRRDLRRCVLYAKRKLLPSHPERHNAEQLDLSAFAILAIRLHLNLDFVFPSRASKLVSSKMRWLVDVDPRRKHIVTTYGSEPLLVEAAAVVMNSSDLFSKPLVTLLDEFKDQLNSGFVDRGENGELTSRLLLLLAKDQATREAWWTDPDFIRVISQRHWRQFEEMDFREGDYVFKEATLFYENPSSPHAFYHRAVKVKDFLRAFLKKDVFDQLEGHFGVTEKWKSLDGAYVNFSHWVFVKGDHASVSYQKKGFYESWLRHMAYICQGNFPSINQVIPVAYPDGTEVTPDRMAYMVISVKNCDDTEASGTTILSKEVVEGVIVVKNDDNTKKPNKNGNREDKPRYTHFDPHLNVRLTLNAVKFINPAGVPSVSEDEECWIKPNEDKPCIAFAMSMGQTERKEDLFAAEDAEANSHRIAFACRGLTNTYQFRDNRIKQIIKDISIRHDRSGKYPQSKLEYSGENWVADIARAPRDNVHHCVDLLCSSDEPMDLT